MHMTSMACASICSMQKMLDSENVSRHWWWIHHICKIKWLFVKRAEKNVSFHSNDGYEMEKYKLVELNWNKYKAKSWRKNPRPNLQNTYMRYRFRNQLSVKNVEKNAHAEHSYTYFIYCCMRDVCRDTLQRCHCCWISSNRMSHITGIVCLYFSVLSRKKVAKN